MFGVEIKKILAVAKDMLTVCFRWMALLGYLMLASQLSYAQGAVENNVNREGLATVFLNRTQIAEAMPVLLVPRLGPVLHIDDFEKP